MRQIRIPGWSVALILALIVGGIALGRPETSPGPPLDLSTDGADTVPFLRNDEHELLIHNFRAVEPGVLYRSSGFPKNRRDPDGKKRPAAFADSEAFEFLRKRNIQTVVILREQDERYAEEGYYEYWARRTGYEIKAINIPVESKHAYDRESYGGLNAATKFLQIMKQRKPGDGAVLIHCDIGKDRTGVAAAAYELWRNSGKMNKDLLWQQVRRRYLAANDILAQDKEVSAFAGGKVSCPPNDDIKAGFVCPAWIDKIRDDLELIAQL